jgi:hypothetical protein
MTCPACNYNLPYHATLCKEREISPLDLRLELVNMSDGDSNDTCDACGHRFGYAHGKIADGKLMHRDFDCTNPAVW